MPWARFDDGFPAHRKVRPLSDAAFRLCVSAVCWANANHTDGVVLYEEIAYVSDVKRPRKVAEELVLRGLWEVREDGWTVHDFLDYNPSSEEVTEGRIAKSERQQRWRENKRAAAAAAQSAGDVDASTGPSADVPVDVNVDASTDASRDAAPRARPAPARPEALPTEVPQQRAGGHEPAPGGIPVWAVPLVDQLTAEGFIVTWDLGFVDWDRVRVAIDKSGIPALIQHVQRRHASAKSPAYSARAWVRGWSALPALNVGASLEPAVPQQRHANGTDLGGDDHMARFLARTQRTSP